MFFPEKLSDSDEPYVSKFYETREFITMIKKNSPLEILLSHFKPHPIFVPSFPRISFKI